MQTIQTVLGEIRTEELGFCHSHEHLFLAEGTPSRLNPDLLIDDFDKTKEELLHFKSLGGSAIIDAQPVGSGRMGDLLEKVSRETGIHVIASTGFHKSIFYEPSHWLFHKDEQQLADLFVSELEEGMFVGADQAMPQQRIHARAGLIKTAIDEDIPGPTAVKLLNAAADASMRTGIPVMCHTETHRQGVVVAEHFLKSGLQPEKIVVCHLDRSLHDYSVHEHLGQCGVFLEYDTIGRFKYHDDEQEAKLVLQMLEWGFEELILLGLDTTRARLKSYGGSIGLDHMINSFLPLLKERGVSQEAIDRMMIHNPAQAFSRRIV